MLQRLSPLHLAPYSIWRLTQGRFAVSARRPMHPD